MLFKQVKPFPAFCNGQPMTVENINVTTVKDNWVDVMELKYTLATITGEYCGEGIVRFTGDKYPTNVVDINAIYNVCCGAIGLSVIAAAAVTAVGGAE